MAHIYKKRCSLKVHSKSLSLASHRCIYENRHENHFYVRPMPDTWSREAIRNRDELDILPSANRSRRKELRRAFYSFVGRTARSYAYTREASAENKNEITQAWKRKRKRLSGPIYSQRARAAWLRSKRRISAVKGCRGRMQIRPKLTPKHPFAEKGRYIRAHLIFPARLAPATQEETLLCELIIQNSHARCRRVYMEEFQFQFSFFAQSQVILAPTPFSYSVRE